MDRRDRERYNYDSYDRDYSGDTGYSADDVHYHSARNLTNDFEQHYRSHHPEADRHMPRNQGRDYDRHSDNRSSRHESDYGYRSSRDYDRDQGYRDQGRYSSDQGRYSGRYNDRDNDSNRYSSERLSNSDRYGQQGWSSDRDRYSSQGRMSQDRQREGYGISDYDNMGDSSLRSSRGVPNQGITSSFADDYGTDFDNERRHGLSSGNFGGYGSHSGNYSRYRDDR